MTMTAPVVEHPISAMPASIEALKELPSRRPAPPSADGDRVQWHRVGLERYEVREEGLVVGFVDVVGAVYVALSGPRYDRAVETLQTLDFDAAVRSLCPAPTL